GVTGLSLVVDYDSVVDDQICGGRELGVRLHADADDDEVGGNRFTTRQDYLSDPAVARHSLDQRVRADVHALVPMDSVEERRDLRGSAPFEDALGRLEHGDFKTQRSQGGGRLQSDVAAADDHGPPPGAGSGSDHLDIGGGA